MEARSPTALQADCLLMEGDAASRWTDVLKGERMNYEG